MAHVDFIPADEISSPIEDSWRELAVASQDPNPYFLPEFVKYSFCNEVPSGSNGLIRVRDPESGQMIALLPVAFAQGSKFPVPGFAAALHTRFSASTAPLIRKGCESHAINQLLDWFNASCGRLGLVRFDEFPLRGDLWPHLKNSLDNRGQHWRLTGVQDRPAVDLRSAPTFGGYLEKLNRKKRQSLKRKWRRLGELGDVSYSFHVEGDLPGAMQDFLLLERSGWKGKKGTAMACSPATRELAEEVLCSVQFGATKIEALRLDGDPIAMSIHVHLGTQAFYFKPAYNEEFSRFSPGQLLGMKTIEGMYKTRWATRLDAATRPQDQLASIWRDQQRVGCLVMATSPGSPKIVVDAVCRTSETYDHLRESAKSTLRLVKAGGIRFSGSL